MNDSKSTIRDLQKRCEKFRAERGWGGEHPAVFAKDIVVEAGELLDHFVWDEDAYTKNPKIEKEVHHELVDVLYGVLIMARLLGIDLTTTLEEKLRILDKKYPPLKKDDYLQNK